MFGWRGIENVIDIWKKKTIEYSVRLSIYRTKERKNLRFLGRKMKEMEMFLG